MDRRRSRRSRNAWQVRLIDFGLAVRRQTLHKTLVNVSAGGATIVGASIAGTVDYAAPEQMGKLSGVAVGPRADIFGFGRTCCFALFGTPQPLRKHWKGVPSELGDLLEACLAERPDDRLGRSCRRSPAVDARRSVGSRRGGAPARFRDAAAGGAAAQSG